MPATLVIRSLLMSVLLLTFGSCPPPPPPVINEFIVVPRNQCATAPVAVRWAADADQGRLTISPPTGETPPDPLPSLAGGGFRFATARTDPTIYTLTAERGGQSVTESRMVRIVPNPFITDVELSYNCAEQRWEREGFSDREFAEVITVRSFINRDRQPLLLEFGGQTTELPPGRETPILSPVRFPGGFWRARLADRPSPDCGGGGTTNPGPTLPPPPPVRITVTSFCPTP